MKACEIWVVYDKPSDYPKYFVARLHLADREGSRPTHQFILNQTLAGIREGIKRIDPGLFRLGRHPDDDPKIVETWV